jgi:hypothetical protein
MNKKVKIYYNTDGQSGPGTRINIFFEWDRVLKFFLTGTKNEGFRSCISINIRFL